MKPRIFISSTFYDLKYIREDISNFVKAHDFEPILFEDGDIGYTPGKALDESCYDSMKNADMVILIIGGNYGSPAMGEQEDNFKEYLSVTRKEFATAVNEGIPVYVFVESAVYAEYGVYDCNVKAIESQKMQLTFKATKNVNVFRFIKEIYSLSEIAITEFRKPSEIKDFLSKQWADMFKNYLKLLKEKKDSKQIYDAMDDLQSLIKRMDIMVDGLGQKIMGNKNITYDKVLTQQIREKAREYTKKICENFKFAKMIDGNEQATEIAYNMIKNALNAVRESSDDINFEESGEIIQVIDDYFADVEGVIVKSVELTFFKKWEVYSELCDNVELEKEIIKMLKNNFYNSRLFLVEDKDEDNEEKMA